MISYTDLFQSLTDLNQLSNVGPLDDLRAQIDDVVSELVSLNDISKQSLASLIQKKPEAVPLLASCVGLGLEKLKNQLKHHLGTAGYATLAKNTPEQIINMLDDQFDLVNQVKEQLTKDWTFSDVLLERQQWSRKVATSAQGRGRGLENVVEQVVRDLGLSVKMRATFTGRGGRTAPCDLAIPASENPLIVGAAKGFNSTGSKLTDAVREIETLADVRLPNQFVFAFIDGIGWKRRESDLRRIHALLEARYIDGIYTLAHMDRFKADLVTAAKRLGLL